MLTSFVNQSLGALTVAAQILVLVILAAAFLRKEKVLRFFGDNAVLFALIVALIATSGSLFYSEIAGYEPCKLCWFQRIFMYPQVLLLGLALWKKEGKQIAPYSVLLSSIGALIAGYHYLLQLDLVPSLPCSAVGYSVSCSQRFVMQFGYITIPLMAFTAFLLIIVLTRTALKEK